MATLELAHCFALGYLLHFCCVFQWPWHTVVQKIHPYFMWYYSSDLFLACRYQSGLVTISPAPKPVTCAQALLDLCCDNHKGGSQLDCTSYLQRALIHNHKGYKILQLIKKIECLYKILNLHVKTQSKRKSESQKKRLWIFVAAELIKKKREGLDFIPVYWTLSQWAVLVLTES